MPVLNFAYGSNLHPQRLSKRVASASLIGTGYVQGRRLAFHKKGQDSSGKCDIPEDTKSARVFGALFNVSDSDWPVLQQYEGVGYGYSETRILLVSQDGDVSAIAFLAHPDFIEPGIQPYDWYKNLVLEGARYHAFPQEYVRAIENVISIPDPDTGRSRRNEEIINTIRADGHVQI